MTDGHSMAAKRDKIRIEIIGPADGTAPIKGTLPRSQDAVLLLARLIGRQMAREQFEQSHNDAPRANGSGDSM